MAESGLIRPASPSTPPAVNPVTRVSEASRCPSCGETLTKKLEGSDHHRCQAQMRLLAKEGPKTPSNVRKKTEVWVCQCAMGTFVLPIMVFVVLVALYPWRRVRSQQNPEALYSGCGLSIDFREDLKLFMGSVNYSVDPCEVFLGHVCSCGEGSSDSWKDTAHVLQDHWYDLAIQFLKEQKAPAGKCTHIESASRNDGILP